MMQSKREPELIRPEIFKDTGSIDAWFTCKNAELYNDARNISGLNLGFNTREEKEVVNENRSELLNTLGIDPDNIAFAEQVHGNRVQMVESGGT